MRPAVSGWTVDLGSNNRAHIRVTPAGSSQPSVLIDGDTGSMDLHPVTSPIDNTVDGGNLKLFDASANARVEIEGQSGDVTLRARVENDGSQTGANLKLFDGRGGERIHLDGHSGNIRLTGDIFLTGADCAEEFAISGAGVDPGTVVVTSHDGAVKASEHAYDRCVAGVISGAGICRPALVLNRQPEGDGHLPVALAGRVYCRADADYEPIAVGDLLTTSDTQGHAMKASDATKSFGAVIGKALQPLAAGRGLISLLVAMQ